MKEFKLLTICLFLTLPCFSQSYIAYKKQKEFKIHQFHSTRVCYDSVIQFMELDSTLCSYYTLGQAGTFYDVTFNNYGDFIIYSPEDGFLIDYYQYYNWQGVWYDFSQNIQDGFIPYKNNHNDYINMSDTSSTIMTHSLANSTVSNIQDLIDSKLDTADIPINNNELINGSGYITGINSSNVISALGYSPLSSEVDGSITNELELPVQTGNSGKILSTNGISPTWITSSTGTVTSVGLSSTDFSISGSPITTSGSITTNLTTTGVSAGNYTNVTVDTKGRVSSGMNWTLPTSTGARSFNTAYRESTTNPYNVSLSSQISCALSLSGGQSGTISLEISANGTTGWAAIGGIIAGSNTGTLTIGLSTAQITGGQLTYDIPATYYYRLATNNLTGSPTYTFNGGAYKILQ